LITQIKKILPESIKIIDSGEAVARQTKNILEERIGFNNQLEKSTQVFYTNSNPQVLNSILKNKYPVIFKDF
jgi:glutamate racemase